MAILKLWNPKVNWELALSHKYPAISAWNEKMLDKKEIEGDAEFQNYLN